MTTIRGRSTKVRSDLAACARVPLSLRDAIFFPTDNDYDLARTFCNRCPVVSECLVQALECEEPWLRYGMHGGLSPSERKLIWVWMQGRFDFDPTKAAMEAMRVPMNHCPESRSDKIEACSAA